MSKRPERKRNNADTLTPPKKRGRGRGQIAIAPVEPSPSWVSRRFGRPLEAFYRYCTRERKWRLGTTVRGGLAVLLGVWAGGAQFGMWNSKNAAYVWIFLYLVHLGLTRLRRGTVVREYADAVERVNSNLAGTIDDLTRYMTKSDAQRITHDEAHALTYCVLACIRDYTTVAVQLGADHMVRVSLSVPLVPRDPKTDLRVWCYDDNHANRRWSVLEYGWSGAPAAFTSGQVQILDDVNEELHRLGVTATPREFQSVACIPVRVGGQSGRIVGVVSIDVRERGFFTVSKVRNQIFPLIAPAVSQIGAILTIKEEGAYAFER